MTSGALTAEVPRRPRGRPRDEGARDLIVTATVELLAEVGFANLTVDAVAHRAGVGKATIYRRWASKERLVFDAMAASAEVSAIPATGSLEGDLAELYGAMADRLANSEARNLLASMLALAAVDPEVDGLLREVAAERKEASRTVLAAAVERGELPPTTDVALAVNMLSGAIIYRACFVGESVDTKWVRSVIDTVLAGLRHRP